MTGKPTVGHRHARRRCSRPSTPRSTSRSSTSRGARAPPATAPRPSRWSRPTRPASTTCRRQYDYAKRGLLQDLDALIAHDPTFEDVWEGNFLENSKAWTPDNPNGHHVPARYTGLRVIHWDAKLFEDWGVEPLSAKPTVDEITEKAKAMTGNNPVTGEQNYGYWYQGEYISWQFQTLAHAMGANWGQVNDDGTWTINWNTPEYLAGVTSCSSSPSTLRRGRSRRTPCPRAS